MPKLDEMSSPLDGNIRIMMVPDYGLGGGPGVATAHNGDSEHSPGSRNTTLTSLIAEAVRPQLCKVSNCRICFRLSPTPIIKHTSFNFC